MKYIFFFSLSLFAIASVHAQKKPATKPTATNAVNKTTENAKAAPEKTTAMQAVYMVSGTPEEFKKYSTEARTSFEAG